jgi:hypothetical protein
VIFTRASSSVCEWVPYTHSCAARCAASRRCGACVAEETKAGRADRNRGRQEGALISKTGALPRSSDGATSYAASSGGTSVFLSFSPFPESTRQHHAILSPGPGPLIIASYPGTARGLRSAVPEDACGSMSALGENGRLLIVKPPAARFACTIFHLPKRIYRRHDTIDETCRLTC